MIIQVVGKQLEITDSIRTFAEGKVGKLTKYLDKVQQITVRLEQMAHNKGFNAEVVVDVELHDDFVSHATNADMYAALDEATDKVHRQMTTFKEKLKQGRH
jgi:putative sigma-54 modulation protein